MTIAASAIPTPNSKPNGVFPFVDLKTGCLTEHGLKLLSQYYNFTVGMNRITPCNASGTNVITLTPLDASPLIKSYASYEVFAFTAANTSTGAVTATVVPRDGALATLRVFVQGVQANAGDLVAGLVYLLIYADNYDGTGGFALK